MREFRKKQSKVKKVMNICVVFTALFMLFYIVAEPSVVKVSTVAVTAMHYAAEILVIVSLGLVLYYYSKYSSADGFLTNIEYALDDCGYYLTARKEKDVSSYYSAVFDDLVNSGYSISENIECNELEFNLRAIKRNEIFYIYCVDILDKNDVIAYLDSATYDLIAVNLKRSGNAVLLFICKNADEGAISLSKNITLLGRKERLKLAVAIAETDTGRVYFLGNKVTKNQQMIANYVMNCEVPIKDEYKFSGKLSFQKELDEKMKGFNLTDFRNGEYI